VLKERLDVMVVGYFLSPYYLDFGKEASLETFEELNTLGIFQNGCFALEHI
jgi:hypothetical protein